MSRTQETLASLSTAAMACCFVCALFIAAPVHGQRASSGESSGIPHRIQSSSGAKPQGMHEQRTSPDTVRACAAGTAQLRDEIFDSHIFGGIRHYRIFLPADYDSVSTRYPVIYYFHGHSDRYTLEDYDQGQDTVPKICQFVASHPVILGRALARRRLRDASRGTTSRSA